MRGHALLGDPESRQSIEHGQRGLLVGSAVIEAIQDVAMEIDVTHRRAGGCSTAKSASSLLGLIARVRDRGARFTPGRGPCMGQGEKRQNSVLFSLRQLRQIEESR